MLSVIAWNQQSIQETKIKKRAEIKPKTYKDVNNNKNSCSNLRNAIQMFRMFWKERKVGGNYRKELFFNLSNYSSVCNSFCTLLLLLSLYVAWVRSVECSRVRNPIYRALTFIHGCDLISLLVVSSCFEDLRKRGGKKVCTKGEILRHQLWNMITHQGHFVWAMSDFEAGLDFHQSEISFSIYIISFWNVVEFGIELHEYRGMETGEDEVFCSCDFRL